MSEIDDDGNYDEDELLSEAQIGSTPATTMSTLLTSSNSARAAINEEKGELIIPSKRRC